MKKGPESALGDSKIKMIIEEKELVVETKKPWPWGRRKILSDVSRGKNKKAWRGKCGKSEEVVNCVKIHL